MLAKKVDRLNKCHPSQSYHDWWDDEDALGSLRLRGVESRSHYADVFVA
jgi:hypothetical protein